MKTGDWNDPSRPETGGKDGTSTRYFSLRKIDPEILDANHDTMEKEVHQVGLLDHHKKLDPEYTKNELKVELEY